MNLTCNFYFSVFSPLISVIKATSFRFVQLLQPACITPVAYSLLGSRRYQICTEQCGSTAISATILAAIGAGSTYGGERNNRAGRSTSPAITCTENRESGSKNEKSRRLLSAFSIVYKSKRARSHCH